MQQSSHTATEYDVPLLMYTMMPLGGSLKAPYLLRQNFCPPLPTRLGPSWELIVTTIATVRLCLSTRLCVVRRWYSSRSVSHFLDAGWDYTTSTTRPVAIAPLHVQSRSVVKN